MANNQGWLAIKDLQMDAYGKKRRIAVDFTTPDGKAYSPDIAAAAKAFGLHAQKVTHARGIAPAVKKALASGKPALVEVVVHREFPYSGSPAVGWWDVPVPDIPEGAARGLREGAGRGEALLGNRTRREAADGKLPVVSTKPKIAVQYILDRRS